MESSAVGLAFFDARSCKDSLGPLKPLRFQFISSIFSFQIHIFLTKVLRFLRDFCLFVIPSLSFTHTLLLSAADCRVSGCKAGRDVGCMKTFHSLDQMRRKKMYTKATVKFESLKCNRREMKTEAATNV